MARTVSSIVTTVHALGAAVDPSALGGARAAARPLPLADFSSAASAAEVARSAAAPVFRTALPARRCHEPCRPHRRPQHDSGTRCAAGCGVGVGTDVNDGRGGSAGVRGARMPCDGDEGECGGGCGGRCGWRAGGRDGGGDGGGGGEGDGGGGHGGEGVEGVEGDGGDGGGERSAGGVAGGGGAGWWPSPCARPSGGGERSAGGATGGGGFGLGSGPGDGLGSGRCGGWATPEPTLKGGGGGGASAAAGAGSPRPGATCASKLGSLLRGAVAVSNPAVAIASTRSLTAVALSVGAAPSSRAQMPATCGHAIDVPQSATARVREPIHADTMFTPGANTSTHGPKLENEATWSAVVEAPTVRASGADAGERVHASVPSLPAATVTTMPRACNAATIRFVSSCRPDVSESDTTLGRPAASCSATHSSAASVADVKPAPLQSSVRSGWIVASGAMPNVAPQHEPAQCVPCPWQSSARGRSRTKS